MPAGVGGKRPSGRVPAPGFGESGAAWPPEGPSHCDPSRNGVRVDIAPFQRQSIGLKHARVGDTLVFRSDIHL